MEAPYHILEMQQWDREGLEGLYKLTLEMERRLREGNSQLLADCQAVNLFYQPSTRTHASFRWAERRLGMEIMFDSENAGEFSSAAKGETIEDSIAVQAGYAEDPSKVFIVIRHPDGEAARIASEHSGGAHIINAGCGKYDGQHPTQTLTDYVTIRRERPEIQQPRITFVGDPRNGRTVRSASYIAPKAWPGCKLHFVSPPSLRVARDITDYLHRHYVEYEECTDAGDLDDIMVETDILYMTRFQREDLTGDDAHRFEAYQLAFQLSPQRLAKMKPEALILHPLPRNKELPPIIDPDPRAAYFRQATNGKPARMALMCMMASASQSQSLAAASVTA